MRLSLVLRSGEHVLTVNYVGARAETLLAEFREREGAFIVDWIEVEPEPRRVCYDEVAEVRPVDEPIGPTGNGHEA